MLKINAICFSFLILLLVSGCSNTPPVSSDPNSSPFSEKLLSQYPAMTEENLFFSLLRNEYVYWKGTPYRFGGANKKGIDCSALVQAVYKNSFKIKLPRTTLRQVNVGFYVKRNALKLADLVFFKIARRVRHVGIYLGNEQFLHVSTSKGVIISSLNNTYWKSKYWQSRRIIN